ncbi:hypothetical protein C3L23_02985 [Nautilia sp. PV-1]|uniref:hypothetical protein n=1 Tax=Nautilia sp. PV-1 TaxID=2579250 RepID=UPI000FD81BE3|nr:hypothetical protein [Nautilia sp. PV-1]AZV46272.1 hypothetical protein C3L23_02985 [Nautilia sp. PV-1]
MRGLEALEFFLENWHSKIRDYDNFCEFDAMVEYHFGNDTKLYSTNVVVEKFFERKISINNIEDINEFLPEEVEFDSSTGNLYIKRNLFEIKIAPRIC